MMLKEKKLEYQKGLEEYMEEQKLYELFEGMMKGLITDKPGDPVKYLIEKLESQETRRIVLIGPPGSKRKEIALTLADHLQEQGYPMTCISVGDLINKEVTKHSDYGIEIEQSRQTYSYVKDEIVIELVKMQVQLMEQEQRSWIIEGFPRTEIQAVALQKMGVIPDKFVMLKQEDSVTLGCLDEKLQNGGCAGVRISDPARLRKLAESAAQEYNLKMEGVKKVCQGQITEMDTDEHETLVAEEIVRILKLKNTKAPRRPQRVILLGPPGSQKEAFAEQVAQKYQLVYIRVSQLITDHIRREENKDYLEELRSRLQNNQSLPDRYIIELVQERLQKPDCRINGWILDGCPATMDQIKLLKAEKIAPQLVVALEMQDEDLAKKLESCYHDPFTNLQYFSEEEIAAADPEVQKRLQVRNEPAESVEDKLLQYRDFLAAAEVEFQQELIRINGEEGKEKVFLSFCNAIEHSV